jgi:uncharacterized protein YrzB (UPF0473 family)
MTEKLPRESGMQRIVGVDPETESSILDYFKGKFEREKKGIEEKELDSEIIESLPKLFEFFREFLLKYGIEALEIKENNIHAVDFTKLSPELFQRLKKKFEKTDAIYTPKQQAIVTFLDYRSGKLKFFQALVHEMFHAQSFQSFQKAEDSSFKLYKASKGNDSVEEIGLSARRVGLNMYVSDSAYFENMDEAIIQELTMRFEWKYFHSLPNLTEELRIKDATLKELEEAGGDIEKEKRIIATVSKKQADGDNRTVKLASYPYQKEREGLEGIIKKIYESHKSQFSSIEEVFDVFAKASLTGRVLPLAHLIEDVYGKGGFRKLGEETIKEWP